MSASIGDLISEMRLRNKPFPLDIYLLLVSKAGTVAALNYFDGARELAKYLGPIESKDYAHLPYPKFTVTWDIIELATVLYPAPVSKAQVKSVAYSFIHMYSKGIL